MSDIEFEIVEKPSAGKRGLMRIKQEKPALERLVDACKVFIFRMGNAKHITHDKLEVAAENVINGWNHSEVKEIAKILLELEAQKVVKVAKEEGKFYKSDVWFATDDTTWRQDMHDAQMNGKKYISLGDMVNDHKDNFVCCTDDLIDDMEGSDVK